LIQTLDPTRDALQLSDPVLRQFRNFTVVESVHIKNLRSMCAQHSASRLRVAPLDCFPTCTIFIAEAIKADTSLLLLGKIKLHVASTMRYFSRLNAQQI